MWIAFVAGWLLGSVTLYAYFVATAKEPQHEECMDCRLTQCDGCPYVGQSREELDRAA
ncbi:MAG: hypothetical protein M1133_10015 [Armatimonadetes bacterium]|nr:hypothetical protein [Armatimonadota bacterium]